MENNIYIIAKKFYGRGSLAYRCKTAGEAHQLSERLAEMQADGLQIVVLNSPAIYSEYAPYTYKEELEEFIAGVSQMGRGVPLATHSRFTAGDGGSENKRPRPER